MREALPDEHVRNRRRRFKDRARAEYIAGADKAWLQQTGRPMTPAEREQVVRHYPGDEKVGGAATHLVLSRSIADWKRWGHRRREASAREPIPHGMGDRR